MDNLTMWKVSEHSVQGQNAFYLSPLPLRHQLLNSIVILKVALKESPEALIKYRIPVTGPRPTESDSPRKGSVNLYFTPDGSLIYKREPISILAGIPK